MIQEIDNEKINYWHRKSNYKSLFKIIATLIIIFINNYIIFKISGIWFVKILLILFNGFIFSGFFSIIHYCSHDTFFKNKKINRIVGNFFSNLILLNFSMYKYFHLQHHRFTSVAGDSEPAGEITNIWKYLFYCLNWDFIFAFSRLSKASLLGYFPYFVKNKKAKKNIFYDELFSLLFLLILIIITVIFKLKMLIIFWIPLQLGISINYFLTIGEHYGCEQSKDIFSNTRNFAVQNFIFNFFHYYSNYHGVHHLYPLLPPVGVKKAYHEIGLKFKYHNISYISFNIELFKKILKSHFSKNQHEQNHANEREKNFFYTLKKDH